MKKMILLLSVCSSTFCKSQIGAVVFDPSVIEEKVGDLDGDGMAEMVRLINTLDTSKSGQIRELQVLKKMGREWIIWTKSTRAVLPSKAGGLHGDPFEYMEIEKGELLIRQSGGNAWKWGQTDRYKFKKGALELVSYQSIYGKPCEYWAHFSYTANKSKWNYKKVFEQCDTTSKKNKTQKEHFRFKLRKKITLENRYEEMIHVISPKLKQEIYF
ncbi:MAG TPA: hypothetical protein PK504_07230 [Ferruginibacter sp.]|nr:hypothetical protein [Ferruginibacter sp.]HRE64086.1 hypothetical protein [Ferruginibacter sp.]